MLRPRSKSKLFIGLDPSDGQDRHGDVLLRPLEREAGWGPSSCSPCCWGRAHLGCIQGILGDVVLQGSVIAVSPSSGLQTPGRGHCAVLLNIVVALKDLQGPGHEEIQTSV